MNIVEDAAPCKGGGKPSAGLALIGRAPGRLAVAHRPSQIEGGAMIRLFAALALDHTDAKRPADV